MKAYQRVDQIVLRNQLRKGYKPNNLLSLFGVVSYKQFGFEKKPI